MPPRRFPPPWSVEEQADCFVVRDHTTSGIEPGFRRRLRTSAFPKVTTTGLLNQTTRTKNRRRYRDEIVNAVSFVMMSRNWLALMGGQGWSCDTGGCNRDAKNQ